MNNFQKIKVAKLTENGDKAYSTLGDPLLDIFFLSSYFDKHIEELPYLENTKKNKLFSMFMRDPRHGQGRRDIGRHLMAMTGVKPEKIVKAGRFDDLWHNPTDKNISYLKEELFKGNALAKKWMPRLTSKNKKTAKAFCKEWKISEIDYRKLIKETSTTEYKLSYAEHINTEEDNEATKALNQAFTANKYSVPSGDVIHPLWDSIKFSEVPSLAMVKYSKTFLKRDEFKDRFMRYLTDVKENKTKMNTATATIHEGRKVAMALAADDETKDAGDTVGKKILSDKLANTSLNCLCVLDTSASMGSFHNPDSCFMKAMTTAHALTTTSTYARNTLVSFSSQPRLMKIKGTTLNEQYRSMYTGDISNTNLEKVFNLLSKDLSIFPEFIIVLSDMEFDNGCSNSREYLYKFMKANGIETKLVWWNFNDRNKTVPEIDEYGNYYLGGTDINIVNHLRGKEGMTEFLNTLLDNYKETIKNTK